jgi:hypothetical protein
MRLVKSVSSTALSLLHSGFGDVFGLAARQIARSWKGPHFALALQKRSERRLRGELVARRDRRCVSIPSKHACSAVAERR